MAEGKLSKRIQSEFVKYLRLGVPIRHVCLALDITQATYYQWLNWGAEEKHPKYVAFRKAVLSARGEIGRKGLKVMNDILDDKEVGARERAKVAQFFVERTMPEYAPSQNVRVDQRSETHTTVQVLLSEKRLDQLSPDQLMGVVSGLAELGESDPDVIEATDGEAEPLALPDHEAD